MIYQGRVCPLESETLNRYELLNEYFVLTCSYATFFWVQTTDLEPAGCNEGVPFYQSRLLRFVPYDIVNNDWLANALIDLLFILIALNLFYFAYLAAQHTKRVAVKYTRLIPWTIKHWIYGSEVDQSRYS